MAQCMQVVRNKIFSLCVHIHILSPPYLYEGLMKLRFQQEERSLSIQH